MVRASPRQGEGPRFESEYSYQLFGKAEKLVGGSQVVFCDIHHKNRRDESPLRSSLANAPDLNQDQFLGKAEKLVGGSPASEFDEVESGG